MGSLYAVLGGTTAAPVVELEFPVDARHATTGELLRDWVKTLPGRTWDAARRRWRITAIGPKPDLTLAQAGFCLIGPDDQPATADDLVLPFATPRPGDPDGMWQVHPRMGGGELAEANLGVGAMWLHNERVWVVHPSKLVAAEGREVAGWVIADDRVLEAARSPLPRHDNTLRYEGTVDGLRGVPVTDLACVSSVAGVALGAVGLDNVHALLHHIPRRYIDMTRPMTVKAATAGDQVAIVGTVTKVTPPPDRHGMLKATVTDTDGTRLSCRWFNAGYMARKVKHGSRVVVFGKVETFGTTNGWTGYGMTNPLLEPVEADSAGRIIGFYPASGKNDLSTWTIYRAAREAVGRLGTMADPVPADILAEHGLPSRADAFRMVHDPARIEDTKRGRDRLAYDELLRLQLVLATSKAQLAAEEAYRHDPQPRLVADFLAALPFPITGAQRRAIGEITADMASGKPMHRLLQGDVGSGKTVVALSAVLTAVASGHQAAFLAPTEILASQHHLDIARMVAGCTRPDGAPLRVELLTNKVTGAAKKAVLAGLAAGDVDVVVGTHAILADQVAFRALSCVVVDEQHRFGVEQRRALRQKGAGRTPDMLYATATPIPRTAAMTTFGDLDVSTLDEMPPGRTPIVTQHVEVAGVNDRSSVVWRAVRTEVESGRQAFVVTPLVATSQTKEDAAAHATAVDLSRGVLAGLRIGVVTGKDKPADRAEVMAQFAAGDLDVLVATTVIEVGVNVPNATVMVVLGADKFGLAQLHQLRGRVGRGNHPGTCFLVAEPRTVSGRERMDAMVETTDGFVLAERDLQIRGAGHISGSTQSGSGRDLLVADVLADTQLLEWAKRDAGLIVAGDPALTAWPTLRGEIERAVDEDAREWLLTA